MNHFRYYTIGDGLRTMTAATMIAFLPQLLPFIEDVVSSAANDPEFTMPALPAQLDNFFPVVGMAFFVMGAFRFVVALSHAVGGADQSVTSAEQEHLERVQEANEAERNTRTEQAKTAAAAAVRPAPERANVSGHTDSVTGSLTGTASMAAEAYSAIKTDAERLAQRWDRARVRHLEVKDAYAAIITDPLNALTHSVLFDVSDTRTEAFILAYAKADELFDYHDTKDRTAQLVEEYENSVLLLPMRWDDALRYAEKVGSGWLPADDAKLVATATHMIQRARNTTSEAEARVSWRKAKAHIDRVRSFNLPMGAVDVLEQRIRGELAPAAS